MLSIWRSCEARPLYPAGLLLLASARELPGVMVGAGVLIGVALACTASGIALAVGSRAGDFGLESRCAGLLRHRLSAGRRHED